MRLRQKILESREYGIYTLTKYYAEQGVPHGSTKLLCSTPFFNELDYTEVGRLLGCARMSRKWHSILDGLTR